MEEATMNQKDPVFTAVQEDATSFCMDWPVFENDLSRENQFKGTVFVLDSAGARIVDTPLESPHTHSAGRSRRSSRSEPTPGFGCPRSGRPASELVRWPKKRRYTSPD